MKRQLLSSESFYKYIGKQVNLGKVRKGKIMSLISKITGIAANQVAKHTGKALKYTKNVLGVPVTHYVKTGTEVMNSAGIKSVVPGVGNKLSQYVKQIITYPKGFFGNTASKTTVLVGANNQPIFSGAPKEVGKFLKDWKGFVDVLKKSA